MKRLKKSDDGVRSGGVFTRRSLLVGLGQTAIMAGLGTRLYQLQVSDASRYRRLAEQNRIDIQMFVPTRGRILDRNGEVLAGNQEIRRLVIIPDLTNDLAHTLKLLGRIISLPQDRQRLLLRRAAKQNRRIPLLISTGLSWEETAKVNVLMPELSGVQTESGYERIYPMGADFGHLTGYVGAIERFEIDDDAALRLPGVRIGKAGVERAFNDALRGRGGHIKVEIDAKGHILRSLDKTDSIAGGDVKLSIDTRLQRRAMHRLRKEKRASVVAMDIHSGQIMIMASNPAYDPQLISSGISRDNWNKLLTEPGDPLNNRSIRGQYPPGSTFKMVTAMAALEAGVIDEVERIPCYGRYTHGGHTFKCWKSSGHRRVRLHDALRVSCDVYFYEIARRLGINALSAMARRLGFGQTFDCGLLEQKPGLIPDEDWKISRFNRGWLEGETILAGIGQGYVLATPLQLAVMAARIASGREVTPTIVKPEKPENVQLANSLGVNEKHLELVRKGMFAAVNEGGGTGSNAQLPFSEVLVAGKTGTSQISRKSSYRSNWNLKWEDRDHGLFVSYFPFKAPRYAVAAIVEHGGSGGKSAAPLARDIMTDLVALDPINRENSGPEPAPEDGQLAARRPT